MLCYASFLICQRIACFQHSGGGFVFFFLKPGICPSQHTSDDTGSCHCDLWSVSSIIASERAIVCAGGQISQSLMMTWDRLCFFIENSFCNTLCRGKRRKCNIDSVAPVHKWCIIILSVIEDDSSCVLCLLSGDIFWSIYHYTHLALPILWCGTGNLAQYITRLQSDSRLRTLFHKSWRSREYAPGVIDLVKSQRFIH